MCSGKTQFIAIWIETHMKDFYYIIVHIIVLIFDIKLCFFKRLIDILYLFYLGFTFCKMPICVQLYLPWLKQVAVINSHCVTAIYSVDNDNLYFCIWILGPLFMI